MPSISNQLAEMFGIADGDQTPLYGTHTSRHV
jgi:hypothetical protein